MNKEIQYDEAKDAWLVTERGISFEDVIDAIEHGGLLDTRLNRSRNHLNQKVYIVNIRGYPWVVPFVESERAIFLKTAYPDSGLKKEFDLENQADP